MAVFGMGEMPVIVGIHLTVQSKLRASFQMSAMTSPADLTVMGSSNRRQGSSLPPLNNLRESRNGSHAGEIGVPGLPGNDADCQTRSSPQAFSPQAGRVVLFMSGS